MNSKARLSRYLSAAIIMQRGFVIPFPEDFDYQNADVEVIEPDEPQTERSLSRRIALQVLYEVDAAQHPHERVIEQHLTVYNDLSYNEKRYLIEFVEGVLAGRARLDRVIHTYATEWAVDQTAIIDRNILRMALYEFALAAKHVPMNVIIDEAVQLGRIFGSDASSSFIHGVLGTVSDRQDEVRQLLGEATT
jgi:transcription antitermination protein NusB